jgi:hypothetical protein
VLITESYLSPVSSVRCDWNDERLPNSITSTVIPVATIATVNTTRWTVK